MAERKVGSAAVIDPDSPGPGIITERDILLAIASGQDPDTEVVADHLTEGLIAAAPDWSLERAAQAMIDGGFRHLLVVDGAVIVGVLSMRDIVRCWTGQRVA
jgi:CBS domain-containing protein